ncbi:MAG: hypothetical protein WD942_02255, partial [Dehalococcoidia bacterium]
RRTWTEDEFMTELASTLERAEAAAVRRIYDAALEAGLEIRWGTEVKRGSFSVKYGILEQLVDDYFNSRDTSRPRTCSSGSARTIP